MKSIFWKVWGMPIIVGIFSGIGLISALTGDDVWDAVSWLALGFPVAVGFWFLRRSWA
ncbi:MAG TPA: hypothetical protein VN038_09840 [Dyadobacter sp.]|nr:hypothetical protein [Dyadobacter sp.]